MKIIAAKTLSNIERELIGMRTFRLENIKMPQIFNIRMTPYYVKGSLEKRSQS